MPGNTQASLIEDARHMYINYSAENKIDDAHLKPICASMCKSISLEVIYLDKNMIGNDGMKSISEMLQMNLSLKTIYLCIYVTSI